MSTSIVPAHPFAFEGHDVRVVQIDGEPWFVASDVASILGYGSAKDFVRGLDDDERGRHILPTPSGNQEMTIISESGLYSAILRSRVEGAKAFKRWVTREVIPQIRKTGSYGVVPELSPAERMAVAVLDAQKLLEAKDERIAELEPQAEAGRRFLNAKPNGRIVREVAKTLGMKEKELRAFLLEEKLIFPRQALCGAVQYDFKATHREHFESREVVVHHSFGECQHYTVYVTPRGVDLIHRRIEANRRAALEAEVTA